MSEKSESNSFDFLIQQVSRLSSDIDIAKADAEARVRQLEQFNVQQVAAFEAEKTCLFQRIDDLEVKLEHCEVIRKRLQNQRNSQAGVVKELEADNGLTSERLQQALSRIKAQSEEIIRLQVTVDSQALKIKFLQRRKGRYVSLVLKCKEELYRFSQENEIFSAKALEGEKALGKLEEALRDKSSTLVYLAERIRRTRELGSFSRRDDRA